MRALEQPPTVCSQSERVQLRDEGCPFRIDLPNELTFFSGCLLCGVKRHDAGELAGGLSQQAHVFDVNA
jgi:hypothetical protein